MLGVWIGLRLALTVLFVCVGYISSIGLWAKPLVRNQTLSFMRRRPIFDDGHAVAIQTDNEKYKTGGELIALLIENGNPAARALNSL